MLTVTPEALARLSQKLTHKRAATDFALRFRQTAGGWKLRVDRLRPDDAAFTHDGRRVLLLDRAAVSAADALTLTVYETEKGPRLKLRRGTTSAV